MNKENIIKTIYLTNLRAMRCKPEQIYRRMCYLVERDQLYLDPHLSLIRLSAITGTNTLYLSRAINICTGNNFRTMLNDYRIKYAAELLKKNVAPRFSFKDFHQRCGYLSKSAFYTAFKQRMNMTPKEYLSDFMETADWAEIDKQEKRLEHAPQNVTAQIAM